MRHDDHYRDGDMTPFDEDPAALRKLALPSLEAGPHKAELRRSLMRELREQEERHDPRGRLAGSEPDPSSARSHASGPWLPRLGYSLLGAAAMLVIVISVTYLQRGGGPSGVGLTPHSTTQGFTAALGIKTAGGNSAGDVTPPSATEIADAIANGDFALDQAITSRFGRVFLYRVKLSGAREAEFASEHLMPADPALPLRQAQELEQEIGAEHGRFIGERAAPASGGDGSGEAGGEGGAKVYRYRLGISDGTRREYASDLEPDSGKRQRHQAELDRLISQDRGEIYKTIAGPNAGTIYLIKVTLADGTIRLYASPEKPNLKGN